jgi:hypothetical protein
MNGNEASAASRASIEVVKEAVAVSISVNDVDFDGQQKMASISLSEPGLVKTVLYNGSTVVPVFPGDYTVRVTVQSSLYQGEAEASFRIRADGPAPIISEAVGGVIRRTYSPTGQEHPLQASAGVAAYLYQGLSNSGQAYGPSLNAPIQAGKYTVRVAGGSGAGAGVSTAEFFIDRAVRALSWKSSGDALVVGQTLNLSERLIGADNAFADFSLVGGAATLNSKLIAWGDNGSAPDGYGGETPATQLMLPEIPADQVKDVALGDGYGLLLTREGHVLEWGGYNSNLPAEASDGTATSIAAGTISRALVTDNGHLVTWGIAWIRENPEVLNEWYLPTREDVSNPPDWIQGKVKQVALGKDFGLALLNDGRVVNWGNTPKDVQPPAVLPEIVAVAASELHLLALDKNGRVHAWGFNLFGSCDVPEAALSGVVAIRAGYAKNYALKADGTRVSWGSGNPEPAGFDEAPVDPFVEPDSAPNLLQLEVARKAVIGLTKDNRIFGWGRAPLSNSDIPSELVEGGPIAWVRAGQDFAVAKLGASTLTADAAGTLIVSVFVPESNDYLASQRVLELNVSDEVSSIQEESPAEGGGIEGLGDYSSGTSATLKFAPDPGYVPLRWILDGENLPPVPGLEVTVEGTLRIGARFGAAAGDDDNDGSSNLLEYAFGSDPLRSESIPANLGIEVQTQNGQRVINLRHPTSADSRLSYRVVSASSPAGPWSAVAGSGRTGSGTVHAASVSMPTSSTSRFFRVEVNANW